MKLIDLHIHTNYSDGDYSSAEVIEMAKKAGLSAIAITDHEIVDGSLEAIQLKNKESIEVISGVEIRTCYHNKQMHLLGYFLDLKNKRLNLFLRKNRKYQLIRIKKIVKKLQSLGFNINMSDIYQELLNKDQVIGRLHIVSAIFKKKENLDILGNTNYSSFADEYLALDGKAFVTRKTYSPKKIINIIHSCGGIVSLAHPFCEEFFIDKNTVNLFIKEMKPDAIEAYYSEHNKEQTEYLINLAKKYNLLVTGGSDFHGSAKPNIKISYGRGNLKIPYQLIEKIKEKHEKI